MSWDDVETALKALVEVCEAEQKAVVALDADRVSSLTPRKRHMVASFGEQFAPWMRAQAEWPPEVSALALHCRRVNALNRTLLALTVRHMDGLMRDLGANGDSGYGPAAQRPRPGRIDSRV